MNKALHLRTRVGLFKFYTMCNTKGTTNFKLVEVLIDGVQTEYSLKDQEILRQAKKIVAIEVYTVSIVSVTPKSRPVVNNTVFLKSFLVLGSADDKQPIDRIPFTSMNKATNNGLLFYVDIPPIAPSKCFVAVPTGAGIVAGESFLIGFHFEN